MSHYINAVYSKKNINSIQADIKNCINNQNNFGYSLKKLEAQHRSQLLFDQKKTGISAELILPQESSTSVKNVRGGHHITNQLGWDKKKMANDIKRVVPQTVVQTS